MAERSSAKSKKKTVEIFTDGACSGNPGPGGYCAILRYADRSLEVSGCDRDTTNNRMEMMAVIEALRKLKCPCNVRVVTDSNYVVKGMTQWIQGWIKRGWINSSKKPVLNRDLWEEMLELSRPHSMQWVWVKGHDGHDENEHCDRIARKAIEQCI